MLSALSCPSTVPRQLRRVKILGVSHLTKELEVRLSEYLLKFINNFTQIYRQFYSNLLPPNHLIDYPHIALDDLDDLSADIFINIIRNRDAVVAVAAEFDCGVNCLEEGFGVNASDDEISLINSFRALGAGADADCREWMANTGEE